MVHTGHFGALLPKENFFLFPVFFAAAGGGVGGVAFTAASGGVGGVAFAAAACGA